MTVNRKMLKKDLQAYLDANKVVYKSDQTKEELYKLAKRTENDNKLNKNKSSVSPVAEKLDKTESIKPVEKNNKVVVEKDDTKTSTSKESGKVVDYPLKPLIASSEKETGKGSSKVNFVHVTVSALAGAVVALGIAYGASNGFGTNGNGTVATYNGGSLTASQVVNRSVSTTATQTLVRNEVVNGILTNMFGSKKADKIADESYKKLKTNYGSAKTADKTLEENGYTVATYKKMVVQSYLLNKYVKDKYITNAEAKKAYKTWIPNQAVYIKTTTTSASAGILKKLQATSSANLSTFFTKNSFTAYDLGSSADLSTKIIKKIASLKTGESASISMGGKNSVVVYMYKHVDKTNFKNDKDSLYNSLATTYIEDSATKEKIISQLFKQGNLSIKNTTLNTGVRDVNSSSTTTN